MKGLSRIFSIAMFVAMMVFMTSAANATVMIDPTTGWAGYFGWNDGLGQIDAISLHEYDYNWDVDTSWQITVAQDSTMTLATAFDAYVAGDEFAFVLDGNQIAWSSTFHDASGYFHGVMNDLLLTGGTHSITLNVTAMAPGFTGGGARAQFSSAVPANSVPEPSTMMLFGLGLIGLAGIRRKAQ